ncbi:hypothetical protein V5P93_007056 [Actinokineospora auranticolor]|uniref:Uncharacterized protein n=1 Tax=Actinokineospora auranticolor TaxID=155976 RepID=A0A2S6GGY5_9PSEU|nr:hypothetical protein [Actinokineospora auranticolor]PPK64494.1 hypothetical protein CLV40_11958 [Actinokineospora auranticolor]
MKLAGVDGIVPVSLCSVDDTAAELAALMVARRGPESAHDPGVGQAAREAAELAHAEGAGLVAVATHPDADPAVLVAVVSTSDQPHGSTTADALRRHLAAAGPDILDVTESRTERGHPVVIAERLAAADTGRAPGCQLQAIVIEPDGRRLAVFTLHSTTGRGWLELAVLLGKLVSSVDFG